MTDDLSVFSERANLERRFVLYLLALFGGGCAAYTIIDMHRVTVLAPLALIGSVAAITLAIAHHVLFKPLRRLVIMAKAVGSGDFTKRLGLVRRDEIGLLATEMDTMCDQLEAARLASETHVAALEQLRHSDRVATLGRLASSVAHELGNPLNVIELRGQLIASGDATTLAQAQQSAAVIVEQTRRMTRIINEILSFARVQPAQITRLDLVCLLRKAISLSLHTSKKNNTNVMLDLPDDAAIEIDGDADKLLQIVVNLVVNGVQAMPGGGTVRISVGAEHRAADGDPDGEHRDYVCIDVADDGVGIPAHLISNVFDPFFSTRSGEGGTGLGLSVAQGIAREHEGWITVESELGHGSSFQVHLPTHGLIGSTDHGR